jgi:hypothetical protein
MYAMTQVHTVPNAAKDFSRHVIGSALRSFGIVILGHLDSKYLGQGSALSLKDLERPEIHYLEQNPVERRSLPYTLASAS